MGILKEKEDNTRCTIRCELTHLKGTWNWDVQA